MAPYDSDSSDEEQSYTETNVLLGYASKKPTNDFVSRLGGHPVCWVALRKEQQANEPTVMARRCDDPLSSTGEM